jgi:hypothetical protein
VSSTARNSQKVNVPGGGRQGERLDSKFEAVGRAFDEQITFVNSLGASDPELVVVFEGLDERVDLTNVAESLGLEILSEVETESEPDPDFPRKSGNQSLPIPGCLHAVCVNRSAMDDLLRYWSEWKRTERLPRGYAPLRDLFAHLKDIRPWGPQDRAQATDWSDYLSGLLPDSDHEVEIELWYRGSPALRQKAEQEVSSLIVEGGGQVLSAARVDEVGYHGMKAQVPTSTLTAFADGDFEAVDLVKSTHVMYVRGSSPSYAFSEPTSEATQPDQALPTGPPVLCVLDGVPVANHPLLADRVIVHDPDDIASASSISTNPRKHGTAMASVAVWGDLSAVEAPALRPVLVRPILAPSSDTLDGAEELRPHELAPDLMRRVFRELFDGDGTTGPVGDSIVVVNLSVGDPGAPFDGVMSAWARTLDWLSSAYGVVVVVSAGNHPRLPVAAGAESVSKLAGQDRAEAVNQAVAEAFPRRSLLAPADAINALTVGALNQDAAGDVVLGPYRFDPAGETQIVSPVSALGSGHRRSIKPDVLAPGGRTFYRTPNQDDNVLVPAQSVATGPGIKVAAADGHSLVFTAGTSPAAAWVSKEAADLVDVLWQVADEPLARASIAAATKALLTHEARVPATLLVDDRIGFHAYGYGGLSRTLATGCLPNEATIVCAGTISANEERVVAVPLPAGLQQTGLKRLTATLAWLSPVNWRHRQYRRAALSFAKPTGLTQLGAALDIQADATKRGTVQHVVWEVNRAIPYGRGDDVELTVQCREQAGGLNGEPVNFAVAISLWVAPELHVDVYQEVREQLQARVGVGVQT